MNELRRAGRKQSKKLYAAGYLSTPSGGNGFARHAVLAVCNVVGAVGLLGLVSYSFFSERLSTTASNDTGAVELRVEQTRALERPIAPPAAFASLGPRIDSSFDGMSGVPFITNSTDSVAMVERVSTPSDAVVLRPALDDAPVDDGAVSLSSDVRRVVIGGGAVAIPESEPIRVASIGSLADVLPARGNGVANQDNLSFGSLFREDAPADRVDPYAATPAPTPVPLFRRGETGNVVIMSFARPPSHIRDVEAESRTDLMRAEEVARDSIEEGELTRDRRLARERFCLAAAIYYESRGEPVAGQKAVAQVILNRVEDERYPNTICGVVFQNEDRRHRCQFSFACDGKPERPRPGTAWNNSLEMALEFLNGHVYEPMAKATHFHANYVSPSWSRSSQMNRIERIGNHIFYDG